MLNILTEIHAHEPRPQISVTLTNGNRVSLDDWDLAEDGLIERWPNGTPRYLVPIAQVVLVEIEEEK